MLLLYGVSKVFASNLVSNFQANPTSTGVQVQWVNNGKYEYQVLTRSDIVPPIQPLQTYKNPSAGLQSFIDPNLPTTQSVPGGTVGTYAYKLQTTDASGNQVPDTASLEYADSEVKSVTTLSSYQYSASCLSATQSSITVGWNTNDPNVSGVTLQNDNRSPYTGLLPSGSQVDGGLTNNTSYNYSVSFDNSHGYTIGTSTVTCQTGGSSIYTYLFSCGPSTTSSVTLSFITADPAVSYINISGDSVPGRTANQQVSPPWVASYVVPNLLPGTLYYYTASLGYNGSPNGTPPTGSPSAPTPSALQCPTKVNQAATTLSDAPSMAQAFASDPSTIYLNWKDNATSTAGSYEFVVQRMQMTPNVPTSTTAAAVEDNSNNLSVNVNWKDLTTSTPYYAVVERSTDPSFVTATFFHYEGEVADLATTTAGSYTPNPGDQNLHPFTNPDSSVSEATTYYYRVRACSQLGLGGYYASGVGSEILNSGPDGEPMYPCTWLSPAFGTTTPPLAPMSLTAAVDVQNPTGKVNLHWINPSKKASYLEIERGSQIIATNLSTTTTSYPDDNNGNGLSAGTSYSYGVRACYNVAKDYVTGASSTACSNWSASAATTTNFVVNVARSGTGGGTVMSDPSGISCGSTCSANFPAGTSVVLSATPDGNSTFAGWGGDCSGTGTCTVSGNTNATATFNSNNNTLTVALSPQVGAANVAKVTINANGSNVVVSTSTTLNLPLGTQVTLTAWSDTSLYTFSSWTGDACNNQTGLVCTFIFDAPSQATANFVHTVGYNPDNLMASLMRMISSTINSSRNFAESLTGGISRIAGSVASGFSKAVAYLTSPSTAEGQTASDNATYNPYFTTTTVITNTASPYWQDTNLLPDTTYVYRVKVLYNDGRASDWSNWAAAKTLYNNSGVSVGFMPICTANSVCRSDIPGVQSSDLGHFNRNPQLSGQQPVEKSERQCTTNADCVNVGRVNQLFQEK